MKLYAVIITLMFGLFSSYSISAPSKEIAQMMETPISTFDHFLFKLHEKSKCYRGWFGNSADGVSKKPCMTSINYAFDDNLIKMKFFSDQTNDQIAGFAIKNDTDKKKMAIALLQRISTSMGVRSFDGTETGEKMGMIQLTPIRYGWSNGSFDVAKIKSEFVKRTVIILTINIKDGLIYTATRSQHGKYSFEKKKSTY